MDLIVIKFSFSQIRVIYKLVKRRDTMHSDMIVSIVVMMLTMMIYQIGLFNDGKTKVLKIWKETIYTHSKYIRI